MEENTILSLVDENGRNIEIDVLDIIESKEYNKEFIIYKFVNLNDEKEDFYASILVEENDSYHLDTIESEEEIKFVQQKIDELAKSL